MKRLLLLVCAISMTVSLSAQSVAVIDFVTGNSAVQSDVNGVFELFNKSFIPKGYTLIDRAKIDKVVKEQNIQAGELTDAQRIHIAKILNASRLIAGDVDIVDDMYRADVRIINVKTGTTTAKDSTKWAIGSAYGDLVKNLATRLANKIASELAAKSKPLVRKRTEVEILLGYLKVYPSEIGRFSNVPNEIIEQVNKQHLYDYDSWRIPTTEELIVLRKNNYLNDGEYMSASNPKGNVLLVTDAKETYSQRVNREEAELKERKANEEKARIAMQKAAEERAKAAARAKAIADSIESAKRAREKFVADSIATEARLLRQRQVQDSLARVMKWRNHRRGFGSVINVGNIIKFDNLDYNSLDYTLGVTYTAGYHFNNILYLGLGTGVNFNILRDDCDLWSCYKEQRALSPTLVSIPVYLFCRVNFINRRCSPFFALTAGYNISGKKSLMFGELESKYSTSGAYFNPQLGVNFRMTPKSSVYFAVGFNGFTAPYCVSYTGYNAILKQKFACAMDFHIGVTF